MGDHNVCSSCGGDTLSQPLEGCEEVGWSHPETERDKVLREARGAILVALMTTEWAADASKIRAKVMAAIEPLLVPTLPVGAMLTEDEWVEVRDAAFQWVDQVRAAYPGPEPLLPLLNRILARRSNDKQRADHFEHLYQQVSQGKCGHSGLALAQCKASICDCFDFPWVTADPRVEAAKAALNAMDPFVARVAEVALRPVRDVLEGKAAPEVPAEEADPYDKVVLVQNHRHSEPVCADPDCTTYLTREQMAELPDAGPR